MGSRRSKTPAPRSPADSEDPKEGTRRRASRRETTEEPPAAESGAAGRADRASERRTLEQAEARIAELEAELEGAQRTIRALLDKAEQRAAGTSAPPEVYEEAARMERVLAERTREAEEKGAALARANDELRDLTSNLDQIVRQRTRALYESEEQLRRKNEELKRLNAMKGEFISIAAHELRTPMTSIVGYLDLMVEGRFGELPGRLQRPIASLRRNSQRLTRLVEEMLDVSRIESGRMQIERGPCELAEIVEDVVDELGPFANVQRQRIVLDLAAAPTVLADADKVHQVVSNLLANALRHTPEGGSVWAKVDYAPEDQFAGPWARLRVRDEGRGIPPRLRDKIFEPFSDVHTAKHHTSSGPDSAGLGLYIARGLVDLHGGLISVDSGEGTEFTVLLPLCEGRPEDT